MNLRQTLLVGVGAAVLLLGVGCERDVTGSKQPAAAPPAVPLAAPSESAALPRQTPPPTGVLPESERVGRQARIKTAKGEIVFELFGQEAPLAVTNFIWLASRGFYNGLTFHRVEPGFVIQGGDPLGDGRGGPGYAFDDESVRRNYDQGIVAMANAGPNTNGSQFFIMLADNPTLPKKYTIFGKVTSGMDTVKKIAVGDVMQEVAVTSAK